jgi:hypothetical protein
LHLFFRFKKFFRHLFSFNHLLYNFLSSMFHCHLHHLFLSIFFKNNSKPLQIILYLFLEFLNVFLSYYPIFFFSLFPFECHLLNLLRGFMRVEDICMRNERRMAIRLILEVVFRILQIFKFILIWIHRRIVLL